MQNKMNDKWLEYCKLSKDKKLNKIYNDYDKKITELKKYLQYDMQTKEQHRAYMRKYYQNNKYRWINKEEREERTYNKQNFTVEEDLLEKSMELLKNTTWRNNIYLDFHNVYKAIRGKCMQCKGCDIEIHDYYFSDMNEEDKEIGDKVLFCDNFMCPLYSFRFGEPWKEIKKQEE